MIRRDFIKLVVASLSAYPLAATAQRSIPVIGALSPAARPTPFNSSVYAAFSLGMHELGYVEGKDYSIEWRADKVRNSLLNLKTAEALGIDVPPTLLALADEVME